MEQVGPVRDNVEHVDVHMAGMKTHICNVFLMNYSYLSRYKYINERF